MTKEEKRMMNSLRTAAVFKQGQRIRTLAEVGYGECTDKNIKRASSFMQKLSRKRQVGYYPESKVWMLWTK